MKLRWFLGEDTHNDNLEVKNIWIRIYFPKVVKACPSIGVSMQPTQSVFRRLETFINEFEVL
jgi:hypothetical protein